MCELVIVCVCMCVCVRACACVRASLQELLPHVAANISIADMKFLIHHTKQKPLPVAWQVCARFGLGFRFRHTKQKALPVAWQAPGLKAFRIRLCETMHPKPCVTLPECRGRAAGAVGQA